MTVLVIDVGSSSVRALLFDNDAQPIKGTLVQQSHEMIRDAEGAAYFDVHELQTSIETCLDQLLQHPASTLIQAVGMTTFVGNWIGLNTHEQPLTPLFTYAETRAADDVIALQSIYDATDTHQRTGCPHHTSYVPSQLAWLRRTQPDIFNAVVTWTDLGSYLYRQWFGNTAPMSYSVASWTGLLNRHALTWDDVWLDALQLPIEQLAPLADYTTVQQGLSSGYRERWPILSDVPFYLAIGDGAAANIGVGAVDETAIAISVGTTAAVRMMTADDVLVPEGLWGYYLSNRHLIGGATNEGGNIYQWLTTVLHLPSDADQQLTERYGYQHGLTVVPLLAGERSMGWNPNATGSIAGLRLDTTALDILQASLESVAARLADIVRHLPNADTATTIYSSGGALSASVLWPQLIADAIGRELTLIDFPETTARGCACLLLHHLYNRNLHDFPHLPSRIIIPHV